MHRAYVLVGLILSGAVSVGFAGQAGQAPPPLELEQIRNNLYVLHGGCACGNTTFYITGTGVVMIDTKVAGQGQAILKHLRTVTDKPITTIVNTHTHFDHTGSNAEFGAIDRIVAHENAKASLLKPTCTPVTNCDAFKGANAKFVPNTTFADRRTLDAGNDRIDLYHFGAGHTNGDSWIVFPALRVALTGDLFARKGLPIVDASNGGSALAFADTLARGVAGITNVDTVITGHDAAVPWSDLVRYSELHKDFRAHALAGMKAGRPADAVADAYNPPDKYKDFAIDRTRARNLVGGIYEESKAR